MLYHEVAVALQAQPLAAHFDKTWGAHIGVKAGERVTRPQPLFAGAVSACLVHCQVMVSLHAEAMRMSQCKCTSPHWLLAIITAHADRQRGRRACRAPYGPVRWCQSASAGHSGYSCLILVSFR